MYMTLHMHGTLSGPLGVKFKVRSPIYEKSGMVVSLQGSRTTQSMENIFFFLSCRITELYLLTKSYIIVLFSAPVKSQ